jgi:predicted amidohydrolase
MLDVIYINKRDNYEIRGIYMRIGICQIKVIEGDIERNINYIEDAIKTHSNEKLDLICFPELCISGYDFDIIKRKKDEKALLSKLAKKYSIKTVAGISSFESDKYYDSACIWNEDGDLILEYKKIHLWGDEIKLFNNGEDINVIEIDGCKIGVMICADLGFAEMSKIMSLNSCDLIICPSAWYSPYEDLFKLMVKARAAENQLYVIGINRATGDIPLCGNSCICDPSGIMIAESNTTEEDYISVDIDIAKVKERRKEIPWLKMRLPNIYNKYL